MGRAGTAPHTAQPESAITVQPAAGLTGCPGDWVANCGRRVGLHPCSYTATLSWCLPSGRPSLGPGNGPPRLAARARGATFRSCAGALDGDASVIFPPPAHHGAETSIWAGADQRGRCHGSGKPRSGRDGRAGIRTHRLGTCSRVGIQDCDGQGFGGLDLWHVTNPAAPRHLGFYKNLGVHELSLTARPDGVFASAGRGAIVDGVEGLVVRRLTGQA